MHIFKDLKQAPTLTQITLYVEDSFALEVHIIDQGIPSPRQLRTQIGGRQADED